MNFVLKLKTKICIGKKILFNSGVGRYGEYQSPFIYT